MSKESLPGIFSISGKLWLILLMVQLSNMLFGMTITIANVVLPQIRGTMSASQDEVSWAITLNLVAAAVATPLTGWLAGRLGWRKLMFRTILGFTLACLFCGLALNFESLILFRIGQGLFGAALPRVLDIAHESLAHAVQPTPATATKTPHGVLLVLRQFACLCAAHTMVDRGGPKPRKQLEHGWLLTVFDRKQHPCQLSPVLVPL